MKRLLLLAFALAVSPAGAADVSTDTVTRGGAIYARTCAVCHGASGEGYKADQATALANAAFQASVTDDFLRVAISSGRPGTTMSAWDEKFGGPLTAADEDAVIAYLRSWGDGTKADLDEKPVSGSAERGAALYAANCVKCHGDKGVHGSDVGIGAAAFKGVGDGYLRRAIRYGREGTEMYGFSAELKDQGIEDVVALLRKWQATAAPLSAPRQAPIPLGTTIGNPSGPEPEGFFPFPRVTKADDVKKQLDRKAKFAFVDARAPSDYAMMHIAGAVSVPFYDPDPFVAGLPKDAWLVCYCACPHAESGQLAQKLLDKGFTKVTVLDEGIIYWNAHGYPVRSGREP